MDGFITATHRTGFALIALCSYGSRVENLTQTQAVHNVMRYTHTQNLLNVT